MADNPLSQAVTALAQYVRAHVPSGGVVYDAPTRALPSTEYTLVQLAPPYVDYRGGESQLAALVETTVSVEASIPAVVLETAARTAEQVVWELGLMWHAEESSTLGGAVSYALPGPVEIDYDDVRDDETMWVTVIHTATVGIRIPAGGAQP